MDILILKTNINSKDEFLSIKRNIKKAYYINECTINLEDIDKVLRIRGLDINPDEITSFVTNLGYYCEELPD